MKIGDVQVFIRAVDIKYVYDGLILGGGNEEMNLEIKNEERQKAEKWGAKVIFCEPDVICDEKYIWLPPYCVKICLQSNWSEDDNDSSHLTLVFFVNNCYSRSLESIIEEDFKDLNWKEAAEQYRY